VEKNRKIDIDLPIERKREEDEPSNFRVVIFGDERRDPAEVSGPILSRIFIFGQS